MVNQDGSGRDSQAARDVVARYALLADDGEVADMAALFASDGIWRAGEIIFRGPKEIADGITAMRAAGHAGPSSGMRHVLGASVVDFSATDAAHVSCYWQLVATKGPVLAHIGKFEVDLRKEADSWLVTLHNVTPLA